MIIWSTSEFKNWPPAVSDGLTLSCQRCNELPIIDYRVDDTIWAQVVPWHMQLGVLCLRCLDVIAGKQNVDIGPHVVEMQFVGQFSTVILVPALTLIREDDDGD